MLPYDGPVNPLTSEFHEPAWAAAWIRRQPFAAAPVTPHLLAARDPAPGERILDIGTGAGPIALAAARAVAHGGSVLAVDISPGLLGHVRGLAAADGLSNLATLEADAATGSFPGAPFDVATSQMGVMFFDDPRAAFANIQRHLRPGARLVFATWAEPSANPLHHDVLRALDDPAFAERIAAPGPGPFSMSDAAGTCALLAAAGFTALSHRRIALDVDAAVDEVVDPGAGPSARERLARYVSPNGRVHAPLAFVIYFAQRAP
jgi:SAM-dependent methyltransferase